MRIPEVVGQHLAAAIERKTGLACTLKPPNDVLVGGRKLAGVLCQSSIEGEAVQYVLIGIGINVNIPCDDLPTNSATSILAETNRTHDLNELLDAVLDEVEQCWCFSPMLEA